MIFISMQMTATIVEKGLILLVTFPNSVDFGLFWVHQ